MTIQPAALTIRADRAAECLKGGQDSSTEGGNNDAVSLSQHCIGAGNYEFKSSGIALFKLMKSLDTDAHYPSAKQLSFFFPSLTAFDHPLNLFPKLKLSLLHILVKEKKKKKRRKEERK